MIRSTLVSPVFRLADLFAGTASETTLFGTALALAALVAMLTSMRRLTHVDLPLPTAAAALASLLLLVLVLVGPFRAS